MMHYLFTFYLLMKPWREDINNCIVFENPNLNNAEACSAVKKIRKRLCKKIIRRTIYCQYSKNLHHYTLKKKSMNSR